MSAGVRKGSLVTRRVGSTLVLRENAETPSDDEWAELLDLFVKHASEVPNLKIMIVTDGGGPTTEQRKRLERLMNSPTIDRKALRVAVVSDSMKVRFVASTIALFHQHHKSFGLDELSEACVHLQLSAHERNQVEKTLVEMKLLIK